MGVRTRRLGLAAVLLAVASCSQGRPGVAPQHVFLLTVSGLRADHLSAWNYPRPTGRPANPDQAGADLSVDALAATGVAFAHAFAPSGDSSASLHELLTGRPAGQDASTLAEVFAAAGFRCGAFVTGAAADDPGLTRGFERVFRAEVEAGDDPDYAAVRAAVSWLREEAEPSGDPLLVWLHLSGPAAPWDPLALDQEDFAARFADPDYAGDAVGDLATLSAAGQPGSGLDGQDLAHLVNLYDAEVARSCHLLGRFAAAAAGRFGLLPRDLLEQGVVVLAADRGAELFQHRGVHEDPASLYDATLRVPLVLRHPGSLTGRRVLAELVQLRDVAPTLYDWFELSGDPELDGRSLLALTDAHRRDFERRPVVTRSAAGRGLRTEGWHLIDRGARRELYDVVRDPQEQRDLAAEQPGRVGELVELLSRQP